LIAWALHWIGAFQLGGDKTPNLLQIAETGPGFEWRPDFDRERREGPGAFQQERRKRT
jgi:hypothetical protein